MEQANPGRREAAMEQYLAEQDAQTSPKSPPPPVRQVPPGWYAHPSMADTQRYWDGEGWTSHIAPGAPQAAPGPTVDRSGQVVGACILGVLLPLVGFIWGVVLVAKDEPKGWLPIAVSAAAFVFWFLALQPSYY